MDLKDICVDKLYEIPFTLSQCTLTGQVYTGMPLVDPVYTGLPLGDPTNIAGYIGASLEKLNRMSMEKLTIAAYTGTPLEGQ